MSRIVYIKRKNSFIADANKDPGVKEYLDMSYKAVGSYFEVFGTIYGSGLSRKEQELLMPNIVGAEVTDKEFRNKVQEYFKNINSKIPPDGLRLEVGLERDDSKPVASDNMPLKVDQYIRYRHALGHPGVGKDSNEAEMYQHKMFYIEDETANAIAASKLNNKEDEARRSYFRVIETEERMDQMLIVLGTFPNQLTVDDKKIKLKELSSIDEDDSEETNLERLDRFIQVAASKTLQIQSEILDMIRCSVLERVGTKILIKESGTVIGNNLRETVEWFKDIANGPQANVLRAMHDELARKPKRTVGAEASGEPE